MNFEEAKCRGVDPDLFYPKRGDNYSVSQARLICNKCNIEDECLQYALDNNEKFGIWGGTSPRQRGKIKLQRRTTKDDDSMPMAS